MLRNFQMPLVVDEFVTVLHREVKKLKGGQNTSAKLQIITKWDSICDFSTYIFLYFIT